MSSEKQRNPTETGFAGFLLEGARSDSNRGHSEPQACFQYFLQAFVRGRLRVSRKCVLRQFPAIFGKNQRLSGVVLGFRVCNFVSVFAQKYQNTRNLPSKSAYKTPYEGNLVYFTYGQRKRLVARIFTATKNIPLLFVGFYALR